MSKKENDRFSSRSILQRKQDENNGLITRVNLFEMVGRIIPTSSQAKKAFAAIERAAANYESKAVFK